MDLAETMTQAPVSSAETTPGRRALLLTNITYEVEESGHRTDTPVFHVRSRDSAGQLHTFTIEGFRPYFGIDRSVLADDLGGVCNDRRVLTVSVDCDPDYWRDQLPVEIPSDADAYDVAGYLSETYPVNVEHDLTGYTTLTDEPVARVYVRTPGDVAGDNGMRDLFETTYEADVPFTRRFLISTGITRGFEADVDNDRLIYENHSAESSGAQYRQDLDSCDPPDVEARMCVFDIEVAASEGFPEPHRARDPITAITAYDSYDDSYALFGLTHSAWADRADEVADELTDELASQAGFPDQTDSDDPELADYWLVSDETELLETFHDWVLSRDPDLITGWNASGNGGFDIPYLIQRSYVVQAGQIRDYCTHSNPAVWTDEYNGEQQTGFKLAERCTLDLLEAYSKTQFRELDSETLDAVANAELGYGKTDLASDELNETWRDDPVTFFSYNVRDTQATAEIEAEVELLSLYENLRRFTGAMYETASNNGPMLDTLFLRRADEDGLVLPTNEEADEDVYHGAKVFEPIPGVHPNSVYPDLSSLYPNLFAMLNLGTETIVGDEQALADSEYTADDCYQFPVDNREFAVVEKGEPIDHVDRDEYKGVKTPAGGTREMFDPQYDWLYVVKPEVRESFITSTIDDLISLKNQYSGDLYSAVKRITNSCFTPDTEVLTPDGIKNIRDVAVGDMVYSLNPDTDELETQPVTEVIEKPDYDGELVNIQNSRIDLSVTPDHRVYSKRTRHTDEWESPEAGDLNQYTQYELPHDWTRADDGERLETVSLLDYVDPESVEVLVKPTDHGRTFTKNAPCEVTRESNGRGYIISGDDYVTHRAEIRRLTDGTVRVHTGANRKWIPETYDGDDFIELCMWFVTEGSTYTSETKEYENTTRGETTTVNLAQYDQHTGHHESISALLDRMGLTYYSDDRNHTVASRLLARVLENLCGSTSHDKTLPSFIWDLTPEQKEEAFQTLLAGDGDERDGSYRYTTSSDQLRDDMIRLCFETGRNGRYSKDSGSWRIWYSPGKNNFRMNREGSTSTAENGVYCVQVANNHMLVAGRNGKFQHIPNCYGVIGDSASGGVGFRLYDRRVAEGITLAGRETITHTAETFTDYLQEHHDDEAVLVGGDSVPATEPVLIRDEQGRTDIVPIQNLEGRAGDVEVWSEQGFTTVNDVIKKPNRKDTYVTRTKSGIVHTTEDHGLIDADGTEVRPVDVDEGREMLHRSVGDVDVDRSSFTNKRAWVLGLFAAEGSCGIYESDRAHKASWAINNQNRALLERAQRILESEWGLQTQIAESMVSSNTLKLQLSGNRETEPHTIAFREMLYEGTQKRVPRCILNGDKEAMKAFLEGYHAGDGHYEINTDGSLKAPNKDFDQMDTKHEQLAAGIAYLLKQLGYDITVGHTTREKSDGETETYYRVKQVRWHIGSETEVRSVEQYEEDCEYVYDLETENHHFQAGVGSMIVHNTDSCVTSIPNAPSLGTAKLWASEAVEHVEASYDEFVQERFGFAPDDTHRLAVELENLSSRLFFMRDELEQRQFMGSDGMLVVEEEDSAVKKRYAELVVWDDDDGWIDTDYDDTDADPLTDELDRSTLKYDSTVDYDTFETGPMAPAKFGGPHEYVSVSGFEYVRSDSAQVTRDAQKQVLTDVLLSSEPLPLIETYLQELVYDIEAGEYPISDLGRPKGISQSLDEYGFKDYEDLPAEMQTPATEADGGAYRQTPSPTYRGAKYADDHFEWEEIGAGSKPLRVYIDTVRSGTYPAAYQYDTYPGSGYPDPPEVGRPVDAIAVDRPERLPDQFVLDTEKTIEKELQGPIEPILETLGRDWDDLLDDGHQTGLDAFC